MSCSEHAFNKQKTFPSIFFIIFFDIEVSKVRPKLTFMRKKKKKYISELLSAIYFMLFNIKKIFHSYLINDKVQSKLVLILLSLLLRSLFVFCCSFAIKNEFILQRKLPSSIYYLRW